MSRTEPELTDFDHIHGQGSLPRLLSLLIDSQHTYEAIGRRFGVSKQRIGQLALIRGIDGRQRSLDFTLILLLPAAAIVEAYEFSSFARITEQSYVLKIKLTGCGGSGIRIAFHDLLSFLSLQHLDG